MVEGAACRGSKPPPSVLRTATFPSRGGSPKLKRLPLDLADQLGRPRAFPQSGIAMLLRAADPPAMPGKPIGLANDQHRQLGLAALLGFVIHEAEHLAQRAHLGPREI